MPAGSRASMIASRAARIVKLLRVKAIARRWAWTEASACASTTALARLARALSIEARMAMIPSGSRPRLRISSIFSPVESRAQRAAIHPGRSTLMECAPALSPGGDYPSFPSKSSISGGISSARAPS
jgi:hypothetical protein